MKTFNLLLSTAILLASATSLASCGQQEMKVESGVFLAETGNNKLGAPDNPECQRTVGGQGAACVYVTVSVPKGATIMRIEHHYGNEGHGTPGVCTSSGGEWSDCHDFCRYKWDKIGDDARGYPSVTSLFANWSDNIRRLAKIVVYYKP